MKICQMIEKIGSGPPKVCAVIFQIVGNDCQWSEVKVTIAMETKTTSPTY